DRANAGDESNGVTLRVRDRAAVDLHVYGPDQLDPDSVTRRAFDFLNIAIEHAGVHASVGSRVARSVIDHTDSRDGAVADSHPLVGDVINPPNLDGPNIGGSRLHDVKHTEVVQVNVVACNHDAVDVGSNLPDKGHALSV